MPCVVTSSLILVYASRAERKANPGAPGVEKKASHTPAIDHDAGASGSVYLPTPLSSNRFSDAATVQANMSYERKPQTRVFVGGLGDNMAKEELEREFSKYGHLSQVWVAQNPPGFAFVEFDDDRDANEAIRQMNGFVLNGCKLRVEHSRERGSRGFSRGGARGGGGFSRGGRGGPSSGGFRGGRGGGFGGGGRRGGYDSWGHDDRYGGGDDGGDYGSGGGGNSSSPRGYN
ncbi:RNA-binding protein Rsf1 isoform X2 [Ixodes scapularis]|uniref:RNA-binding protein Rsf1 isoform X2 n=1 Tax=Ixodes scapularis TaxID=6945 RepID=UPI001A9FF11C|nr:RNA-binding protein Rsf1 isoform X2 [Ixodes scapularis]